MEEQLSLHRDGMGALTQDCVQAFGVTRLICEHVCKFIYVIKCERQSDGFLKQLVEVLLAPELVDTFPGEDGVIFLQPVPPAHAELDCLFRFVEQIDCTCCFCGLDD